MDSIRIERLRCLSDTGYVQIKPITVLLGQNSSGKSTFLRFFPLLKQSIESRTTGPILWYGRLVDFGNFDDAHQTGAEKTISFSFKFTLEGNKRRNITNNLSNFSVSNLIYRHEVFSLLNTFDMYLTIEISEDKEKETTWASKVIIQFEDSKIKLEFNKNKRVSGFTVNSLNVLELGNSYISNVFNSRSLLPVISEIRQSNDSESDLALSLSRTSSILPVIVEEAAVTQLLISLLIYKKLKRIFVYVL